MARKKIKNKFYFLENIQIESLSSEAKGIYRNEGKVIFVDSALPGDIVDIQVKKNSKNYEEGKIITLHTPSPNRIEPHCVHFQLCGGCKTQHFSYENQLNWKTKLLTDALDKIAQIPYPTPLPILGCKETKEYRNKLDFAFSSKRWLNSYEIENLPEDADRSGVGFHIAGRFDKIVDIEDCQHMPPIMNSIKNFIRNKSKELGIEYYDIREQTGNLRNLLIRNNTLNEWMVCISITEFNSNVAQLFLAIKNEFTQITSLLYTINTKGNDTIYDLEIVNYSGNDFIYEFLGNLKFKIGPKSFFQTNSKQCYNLYSKIQELAEIKKTDLVYDLYCGVGSIGIFLHSFAKKIVGIELVPEAIEDAKFNVKINNIENCSFFAADMRKLFGKEFVNTHGKPDVIVTDPPRAGMHPDVIAQLLDLEAPRIVYVSCNPQKMASELKELYLKYDVVKILPVDMFPHTLHLETIAVLDLRK